MTDTPSRVNAPAGKSPGAGDATDQPNGWAQDQLTQSLSAIRALAREVEHLRAVTASQQTGIAALQSAVGIVEGRTRRHESGQDLAREVRQEVGAIEEDLVAEAEFRRELAARVERVTDLRHEELGSLQHAIEEMERRLALIEGGQTAAAERRHMLVDQLAERALVDQRLEEQLADVSQRLEGLQAIAGPGEELIRAGAAVPGIRDAIGEVTEQIRALQIEQRRIGDDVAALQESGDREAPLVDLLEQQRSLRVRLEERLSAIEGEVEGLRRDRMDADEQMAHIMRSFSGTGEQLRAVQEALEGQRIATIEHLRRELRATDDSARRQIEEIERARRVAHGLLVQLSEESEEARPGLEPPL